MRGVDAATEEARGLPYQTPRRHQRVQKETAECCL